VARLPPFERGRRLETEPATLTFALPAVAALIALEVVIFPLFPASVQRWRGSSYKNPGSAAPQWNSREEAIEVELRRALDFCVPRL